jgi:hypothetical protein
MLGTTLKFLPKVETSSLVSVPRDINQVKNFHCLIKAGFPKLT